MSSINIIIIIFLISILYVGFKTKSKPNESSYLFVGRKLTLLPFIATLVSTWYGGILEIGRFSYENGITTWIIFGITYYFAAYIFSRFMVPKIINKKVITIPEYFNKNYGLISSIISIIIILFITSPAPYLKIMADIFQFLWDIPYLLTLIIISLFSLIYIFNGGFNSIIKTDKIQFILMYLGFIVILCSAYLKYGGLNYLLNNAPEYAFNIPGNLNFKFIFIWGFISLVTFIDPSFYQRTFSGSSIKTVQKSILVSIFFWFIFDFLTVITGLYALAILPGINTNPYLDLAQLILSPIALGLFIVSLFAIVMSTIDSFSFISSYTIGRDLIFIIKNNYKKRENILFIRLGLLITAALSIILTTYFNYAIDIWYICGSIAIPCLLFPLITILYGINIKNFTAFMLFPMIVSILWHFHGVVSSYNSDYIKYFYDIDPMYPGLLLSGVLFYLFKKDRYFLYKAH